MSRVICVSNRVSLPDPETGEIKAGGLAVGVKAAMESVGGGMWFGWSGETVKSEEIDEGRTISEVKGGKNDSISFVTMPLSDKEYAGYYEGMSNGGLWPLMHELGDHIDVKPKDYETYKGVNKTFAAELKKVIEPGDVIWVHDYHLFPLGQALRDAGISEEQNKILFFNHIPVPSAEFVNSAAVGEPLKSQYKELMKNLEAYDQVGFQASRDVKNYLDLRGETADLPGRFETAPLLSGRKTEFGYFPISIETRDLEKIAENGASDPMVTRLQKQLEGQMLVMGAERLDYTKGLLNRIDAVSDFLKNNEAYEDKIKFLQITPLSRADLVQYKKTIQRLRRKVSRVNAEHTTPLWQPIRYTEQRVPRESLVGMFRLANVGLVTSLMDGQNLVAKEFMAAQNPDDPGVLVLSNTTGAAEEMGEAGALLVDPTDLLDISSKLKKAAEMPLEERQANHQKALQLLRQNDINNWAVKSLKPWLNSF